MKKLAYLAILIAGLLVGVAIAVVVQMQVPMQATVPSELTFTTTIDGEPWTGGTTLDWGTVTPGITYLSSLDVANTGTITAKVYLYYEPLPTDWTLTWSMNGTTLTPTQHAIADIELTVPASASGGTFNWGTYIKLESV